MELAANIVPEYVNPNHPPGAICIASGELSRYPSFPSSLINLLRPQGTTIEWHCGLNVAANFNAGVRRMMANPALQWAWIMGDDHEFEPTTLLRLLNREVDVVVPLCVRRQPPFIPVLFKEPENDTPLGQFPPHHWHQIPSHGLHEVYTAGSAGMLIRRHVLEKIADPWFELGRMGKDLSNEDTYFCQKAQQAGARIYADTDVQLGHWTPMAMWPARTESGVWAVGLDLGQNIKVVLPPAFLRKLVEQVKEESKENFGLHMQSTDRKES